MNNLIERFLRYVKIDTQSSDESSDAPSTQKQFDLLQLLEKELSHLGVINIHLSQHGVLTGTVNATPGCEKVPTIGFIAHVDTAPDASGANVKPLIHEKYNGKDIKLPGDPKEIIKVKDNPNLKLVKGHTVITTDGTTLLGADDKAGIAIIMTMLEFYKNNPDKKHGAIKIAFTPDEEIGAGVNNFDVKAFAADFAYTVDGSELGEIEDETFNASSATITVTGNIIHPGYAKNKMVNALRVLTHLVASLPTQESPEKTDKKQGFYHPHTIQGDVSSANVKMILRDFEISGIKKKISFLKKLCKKMELKFKGAKIELEIKEQYKNMKYALSKDPRVVKYAIEGIKRAGIEPKLKAIRGGTDGARLSYMGLLTPNIFDGGQNFHSKKEWVSVQWMEKGVEAIISVCDVWREKTK